MLSFHQSSRGGHEYTKGKAEAGCLPQLYLAQLYRLSFLLWASTFCFHPKGYSPAKPPGSIKVGHAYWTSQVDCKCKLNVDTKCHLFFTSLVLGGKDSRGQLFSFFSSMCTSLPLLTQYLNPDSSAPPIAPHHHPKPSPAFSLSATACVPLSLPQLSDHTSELAFWRLRLNPWINLCADSEFTNQWFRWKW